MTLRMILKLIDDDDFVIIEDQETTLFADGLLKTFFEDERSKNFMNRTVVNLKIFDGCLKIEVSGRTSQEHLITTKQIEWAYDKWCEGFSMDDIGSALGFDRSTIARHLRGKPKIKKKLIYRDDD